MKKKVILLVMGLFLMSGCTFNTTLSYTYSVDTGDTIEVTLYTTDGYEMTKETPIVFTKDDKELATATFLFKEAYDQYYEAANTDPYATMIEDKATKEDTEYFFYEYDNGESVEYNYFIKIEDTNTGVVITGDTKKDVMNCFENLTFEED